MSPEAEPTLFISFGTRSSGRVVRDAQSYIAGTFTTRVISTCQRRIKEWESTQIVHSGATTKKR
ncbi:MAG: hypothetical protein AAF551_08645, partial [Bacteroidota bacterium]